MNESADDRVCRPFKSWRSGVGYLTVAAVVATAVAAGCGGGGCPRTANGARPCYNDHEILGCTGDPHDVGGQYESADPCPTDRPVCQQQPGTTSGACVSLTPFMCMEQVVATAPGNAQIAVADVDAEGLDDVVFSDGGALWAAVARADGSSSPAVSVATAPLRWSLADLDADGNPDLIGDAGAVDTTTVARGTGRAGFEPAQALAAIRGSVAARGDFDGDGADDVVDDVLNNDNSQEIAAGHRRRAESCRCPGAARRRQGTQGRPGMGTHHHQIHVVERTLHGPGSRGTRTRGSASPEGAPGSACLVQRRSTSPRPSKPSGSSTLQHGRRSRFDSRAGPARGRPGGRRGR